MSLEVEGLIVKDSQGGASFSVKVIPRSSRFQMVDVKNGELKIKIPAPPVEGAANEAVIDFFADYLKISKKSVEVVKGSRSRHKVIKIQGMKAAELLKKLAKQT